MKSISFIPPFTPPQERLQVVLYANVPTDIDDIKHLDLPLSIHYKYISIQGILLDFVNTHSLSDIISMLNTCKS
jgi:hypothetical protein